MKACSIKIVSWPTNVFSFHIKLVENGNIYKIFKITDVEKVLEVDNLDEYINNVSF